MISHGALAVLIAVSSVAAVPQVAEVGSATILTDNDLSGMPNGETAGIYINTLTML